MAAEERPGAVILSGGETPTTDYFLTPHLERLGYAVTLLDGGIEPFGSAFDMRGCRMVVISRYVLRCWFGVLQRLRQQGAKLVYFMDDDLFDLAALQGLPLRYRWKIVTQAWMHRSRLMKLCNELWVSTPFLARKYAALDPVLIEMTPSPKTCASRAAICVCYHGSASHRSEIEWLQPIVETILSQADNVHFELFGAREVSKRFGQLPRVSVLHPMSWKNYLAFTSTQKRDIALAPLLDSEFNAARSPTKFYDYTRMGAVGLYSNVEPYREHVRDGVDGLLLDNKPETWIEAILALVRDVQKRESMAAAARQRVLDVINIDQR